LLSYLATRECFVFVLCGYISGNYKQREEECMTDDKDKGLLGSAADRVRETTSSLRGEGPWHSANSNVYHNNRNCQTGNSIAPENIVQGTGGKPLCQECERLNSSGGPIGNLTNL
jgi:hypothetical protein